jgi:hypothetical protein
MNMTVYNPQSAIHNAQRDTALSLVTAFVVVLLLVQLWLLVGTLEGSLGGEGTIAFPATLASGLCFLSAWQLWRMLPQKF